jgi:hypothetical protein
MGQLDGHEVSVSTTIIGAIALVHRTLPQGWARSFVHRQPIAAMACAWALVGVTLPLVVPPIRRRLKLPTNQYNAENHMALTPNYKFK